MVLSSWLLATFEDLLPSGFVSRCNFLTGPAESINALTKAVGFQYQYDPKSKQYAHALSLIHI